MTLHISSVFTYDTDAGNYIQAVETADGQALESATRQAINNFVIGCKQDGIWPAIKASCILAGARTLAGALVPLANASGVAPTLNGTAGGWNYNRKTGLQGNGTDNYIDSGRSDNAELSQNSKHVSVYVSGITGATNIYIGARNNADNFDSTQVASTTVIRAKINSDDFVEVTATPAIGFIGGNRNYPGTATTRGTGLSVSGSSTSTVPSNRNIWVFGRNSSVSPAFSASTLAFYSIGESLDLAKLDGRVTDLITAFGAAIP